MKNLSTAVQREPICRSVAYLALLLHHKAATWGIICHVQCLVDTVSVVTPASHLLDSSKQSIPKYFNLKLEYFTKAVHS